VGRGISRGWGKAQRPHGDEPILLAAAAAVEAGAEAEAESLAATVTEAQREAGAVEAGAPITTEAASAVTASAVKAEAAEAVTDAVPEVEREAEREAEAPTASEVYGDEPISSTAPVPVAVFGDDLAAAEAEIEAEAAREAETEAEREAEAEDTAVATGAEAEDTAVAMGAEAEATGAAEAEAVPVVAAEAEASTATVSEAEREAVTVSEATGVTTAEAEREAVTVSEATGVTTAEAVTNEDYNGETVTTTRAEAAPVPVAEAAAELGTEAAAEAEAAVEAKAAELAADAEAEAVPGDPVIAATAPTAPIVVEAGAEERAAAEAQKRRQRQKHLAEVQKALEEAVAAAQAHTAPLVDTGVKAEAEASPALAAETGAEHGAEAEVHEVAAATATEQASATAAPVSAADASSPTAAPAPQPADTASVSDEVQSESIPVSDAAPPFAEVPPVSASPVSAPVSAPSFDEVPPPPGPPEPTPPDTPDTERLLEDSSGLLDSTVAFPDSTVLPDSTTTQPPKPQSWQLTAPLSTAAVTAPVLAAAPVVATGSAPVSAVEVSGLIRSSWGPPEQTLGQTPSSTSSDPAVADTGRLPVDSGAADDGKAETDEALQSFFADTVGSGILPDSMVRTLALSGVRLQLRAAIASVRVASESARVSRTSNSRLVGSDGPSRTSFLVQPRTPSSAMSVGAAQQGASGRGAGESAGNQRLSALAAEAITRVRLSEQLLRAATEALARAREGEASSELVAGERASPGLTKSSPEATAQKEVARLGSALAQLPGYLTQLPDSLPDSRGRESGRESGSEAQGLAKLLALLRTAELAIAAVTRGRGSEPGGTEPGDVLGAGNPAALAPVLTDTGSTHAQGGGLAVEGAGAGGGASNNTGQLSVLSILSASDVATATVARLHSPGGLADRDSRKAAAPTALGVTIEGQEEGSGGSEEKFGGLAPTSFPTSLPDSLPASPPTFPRAPAKAAKTLLLRRAVIQATLLARAHLKTGSRERRLALAWACVWALSGGTALACALAVFVPAEPLGPVALPLLACWGLSVCALCVCFEPLLVLLLALALPPRPLARLLLRDDGWPECGLWWLLRVCRCSAASIEPSDATPAAASATAHIADASKLQGGGNSLKYAVADSAAADTGAGDTERARRQSRASAPPRLPFLPVEGRLTVRPPMTRPVRRAAAPAPVDSASG